MNSPYLLALKTELSLLVAAQAHLPVPGTKPWCVQGQMPPTSSGPQKPYHGCSSLRHAWVSKFFSLCSLSSLFNLDSRHWSSQLLTSTLSNALTPHSQEFSAVSLSLICPWTSPLLWAPFHSTTGQFQYHQILKLSCLEPCRLCGFYCLVQQTQSMHPLLDATADLQITRGHRF